MLNPDPSGEKRGLTRNALIQNYCREPNLIQLKYSAPVSSAQHRFSSGAVTVRSHSNWAIENKVDFIFCFHLPSPFHSSISSFIQIFSSLSHMVQDRFHGAKSNQENQQLFHHMALMGKWLDFQSLFC